MLPQTTSALRMRSRASALRSCASTPSHRSLAMRPMSCAIPAAPQRDAPWCGCRSSSSKRLTNRARRSHKVTGSWQRSRNTCKPNKTTKSLAIVKTHALVPWVLVRRDLRLEHELAVLDDPDAVTNLVPPIHPIPSAAPTAPGSASATTMRPTTPPIHPIPSAAPTAPGSASTTTTPTTTTPTTTTPERSYRSQRRLPPRPRQSRPPTPGAAPTAPGPTTPATAHPLTKEEPTTKLRKAKNRIQRTEVDGEM